MFAAPVITGIAPVPVPTVGARITLVGSSLSSFSRANFSGERDIVACCCELVVSGFVVAAIPPFDQTGSTLLVRAPAGQGATAIVTVFNGQQVSAVFTFAYAMPAITRILPVAGAPTTGALPMTIIGSGADFCFLRCCRV